MSYKNLDIWKLAREVTIEVHAMSLMLPKLKYLKKDNKLEGQVKVSGLILLKVMVEEIIRMNTFGF